jgi:hypothetical protein
LSARILIPDPPSRGNRRTALFPPAAVLLLALLSSVPCTAQSVPPEEQAGGFSLLTAAAAQIPLAHLKGSEPADGFANPGFGLVLRGYLPLREHLDLAFDLALPRFKVRTGDFTQTNNIGIEDAEYFGKMLAVGARFFLGEPAWGKPYLVATGGMYQLNYNRYLNGLLTETKGAFRPGAAIGGGVQFKIADFILEGDVRYHRFTDTGNFGLGDLSWIELALGLDLQIGGKKR